MHYALEATLFPEQHRLCVKACLTGMDWSGKPLRFYLNEGFAIRSLEVDGVPAAWAMDPLAPRPAFDTVSRPITCEVERADRLTVEYEGCIPSLISQINQLDPGLVELASYAGWYPKLIRDAFTFDLAMRLPPSYRVASNGIVRREADRFVVEAATPQTDIALFASDRVVEAWIEDVDMRIGIFCPLERLNRVSTMFVELKQGMLRFIDWYGLPLGMEKPMLCNVWRPRGGWGYRRGHTSFMSHEWIEEQFHGEFHEMAHNWWGIADVTAHDWINEGGAEFSSFLLCRALYGADYAGGLLASYREHAQKAGTEHSVAETPPSSPDRYVNHYEKTTLMYLEAARRFGESGVLALLRALYEQHCAKRDATTESFLALSRARLGPEAERFFRQCLYAKSWRETPVFTSAPQPG